MGNFFKALASICIIFLIFFGVPIFIYSSFQRFLGMVPPAELSKAVIYQLATLKGAEAFILVVLYVMIIDRRRGKEARYAFFVSFLLFLQGGLISELWFYLTLNPPKLYSAAGICSSFLSYGLAAWFLSKLYRTHSRLIVPSL